MIADHMRRFSIATISIAATSIAKKAKGNKANWGNQRKNDMKRNRLYTINDGCFSDAISDLE